MAEPVNKRHIECVLDGLSQLAVNMSVRAKMNLTDLHVQSENFFAGLLNIIYGWNLRNANSDKHNAEGVDLVDDEAKVIVQVTGTCSKGKIDHSLSELKEAYRGYHFVFFPVVDTAKQQRKHEYKATFDIVFNPQQDILDITRLVEELSKSDAADKAEEAAMYIKKNLVSATSGSERMASGLEYVIVQLSKDGSADTEYDAEEFRIEAKIAFNNLEYGRDIIMDCASQHGKVQRIYDEYARQGQGKSKAVLHKLRSIYLKHKQKSSGDNLFRKIEREIIESIDAVNMPEDFTKEELLMCVDILMVHAFMECKIFEKPV